MLARLSKLWHHPTVQLLIYLLLIGLMTYLFLWRLWAAAPEDRAYLPQRSDTGEVFYPPRSFFAHTLADGEFALWNPHVYSGYPQFADPQAATFYPVALLTAWITGANFSLETIALDIGFHFFLAGAFSFLFFRYLFKSNFPAFFSALLFEFGGYLTFYPVLQLSELEVVAWFPLTLLLGTLAIERRNWLLMALAGVVMGQVFLAGRPQSYLTIGVVTLTYLAYLGVKNNLPWWRIVAKEAVLGVFALGIAAAQWIPTLQLTRLSTRSILTYDVVSEGGFPFNNLSGFFMPQLLGTQNLYIGLVTLLLAGVAIYHRKGIYWGVVFTASLFFSVGYHLILFDALYLFQRLGFPGYLRNVERLAFAMTFSLAILAGYGVKLLLEGEEKEPFRRLLKGCGMLLGAVLFWLLVWTVSQSGRDFDPRLPVDTLTFVVLMLGGAILVMWLGRDRPKIAFVFLAIIALVDVMSLNQGRFFVEQAQSFAPGNDVARVMAAPPLEDSPIYRTVFYQTVEQDFGSLARVDNTGGKPPLMLIDYELLRAAVPDEYRQNQLLNVEMVVTTGDYPDDAYQLLKQEDNFRYYRFTQAKPRAYLVENVVEVADAQEAADILAPWGFDYWNKALVVGQTGLTEAIPLGPEETAVVTDRTANSITIQVTAARERFLVVASTNYPGWQATIDNLPTELYKTNAALRGVIVPAGTHTIVMSFKPWTFYMGVAISLLTALGVLVWVIRDLWLRRRP